MLRLYGHYASQPSRAVAWLLKIKGLPFDFVKVDPSAGDNKRPDYVAKFPLGLIPAIEEDDGFTLSESAAIMTYLCDRHGWEDWYPSDARRRARIVEYFGSHSETTRPMTRKVFRPALNYVLDGARKGTKWDDETEANLRSVMSDVGGRFERCFLSRSAYIAGDEPTIADLAAYVELAQAQQVLGYSYSREDLSRLCRWLDDVGKVPYHDDVHRTVVKLGNLFQKSLNRSKL